MSGSWRASTGFQLYAIGNRAGTGKYRCCKCEEYIVLLRGPQDQIPPCAHCGSTDDVLYEPLIDDAPPSRRGDRPH